MLHRTARYLLAAIQGIIGWEWFMSGGNKLFSGQFPQGLADILNKGIVDNPNGWYVSILQHAIIPSSIFWGYAIEWTEIMIGLVLIGSAVLLLSGPRMPGEPQHRLGVIYCIATIAAAAMGAFQNINFHFWMGGWVIPTFDPGTPFNEGVDLDALLPLFFLTIIVANIALIQDLTGKKLFRRKARSQSAEVVATPGDAQDPSAAPR
ncbi:MAG TPA: hypothetical protein VFB60_12740 [Ktedonobacteraceae bacterium]|nr:hypothetical protein [Ktedonobacteraceae bacterium]